MLLMVTCDVENVMSSLRGRLCSSVKVVRTALSLSAGSAVNWRLNSLAATLLTGTGVSLNDIMLLLVIVLPLERFLIVCHRFLTPETKPLSLRCDLHLFYK